MGNAGVEQTDNWREYVARQHGRVDELRKAFDGTDKNRDDRLGPEEVFALARRFYDNREPTQAKVNEIMSHLDLDGDGSVSRDEFIKAAGYLQNAFGHNSCEF